MTSMEIFEHADLRKMLAPAFELVRRKCSTKTIEMSDRFNDLITIYTVFFYRTH